jgi:hypothetical protein
LRVRVLPPELGPGSFWPSTWSRRLGVEDAGLSSRKRRFESARDCKPPGQEGFWVMDMTSGPTLFGDYQCELLAVAFDHRHAELEQILDATSAGVRSGPQLEVADAIVGSITVDVMNLFI